MQNQVAIVMCNRVGKEGDVTFAGQSVVVDPYGNVVSKADDQEQLIIVDIDLTQTAAAPRTAAIPGTATTRMVRLKGRMGNKQCHDSPHPSAAFVPAYRYMTIRRLQPAGARRECEVIVRLLREAAQCRIQSSCSSLLWMRD